MEKEENGFGSLPEAEGWFIIKEIKRGKEEWNMAGTLGTAVKKSVKAAGTVMFTGWMDGMAGTVPRRSRQRNLIFP